MKKITLYTTIFLAALLLTFACKKEKPELGISDQDPCGCANEVSADFVIEEKAKNSFLNPSYHETDSTLVAPNMRFRAKELNGNYHWYIGSQEFFDSSVIVTFGTQWIGYDIPITLVVHKDPNSICFPNDDGYDSVTKVFHITNFPVWSFNENPATQDHGTREGIFRLKSNHSTDSIDVGVKYRQAQIGGTHWLSLYNYDGNESNCFENIQVNHYSYRYTSFGGGSGVWYCNQAKGYIKTVSIDNVEFYLTQFEPGHPEYKEYKYSGRWLNSW